MNASPKTGTTGPRPSHPEDSIVVRMGSARDHPYYMVLHIRNNRRFATAGPAPRVSGVRRAAAQRGLAEHLGDVRHVIVGEPAREWQRQRRRRDAFGDREVAGLEARR